MFFKLCAQKNRNIENEINSTRNEIPSSEKLNGTFKRLAKLNDSRKICTKINKLIDKGVSSSSILSQITKHYYKEQGINEDFKEALVQLKNEGKLKNIFEISQDYMSDEGCEKILDTYINKSTKLELVNNEISELPESIGQLSNLQKLNLYGNQISELPRSIGQLLNLKELSLAYNQIREIPEVISNLSKLETLDFASNQISEIPNIIGKLSNLQRIDLFMNTINEVPNIIGQLSNLTWVDLNNNNISEVPENIRQLSNLYFFDLSYNQISQIPESIGELSELERLDLSNNQVSRIPESIGGLSKLERLDLSNNQISRIPESIGQLLNLEGLDLNNNHINIIPSNIGQLSSLYFLDLNNNHLTPQQATNIRNQFQNTGTRVDISIQDSPSILNPEYDNESLTSQVEALKELASKYDLTKKCSNDSIWKELDKPENNSFKLFLDKIWNTNDAKKDEISLQKMLGSLMNIFEKMENNSEYRQMCLAIGEQSINTCGDRVAIGLVQMQLAQKIYPDGEPSVKDLFECEKTMLKAEMIFDIARDKVKNSTGAIDEIETYLMYFNKLKNEVGIELDGMLYGALSNVEDKDIKEAKQLLNSITDDNVYERLLDNPTIQKRFEKDFENIQNQEKFDTEILENETDGHYKQRLDNISKSLKKAKIDLIKDSISM